MLVPVDQLVGMTFGQYQPGRLLGQGSLSTLYAARQAGTRRCVMLSLITLPPNCTGRPRERFLERFMQMASVVRQLSHPNIVPLYDFGEQLGYPYLVSPLNEAGTLMTLLRTQKTCSPEQTLDLLKQMASALDYAHEHGVMHGSLKPSVIQIDAEQSVQISGFGLTQMMAMQGVGHIEHSHPHLFSVAGTLLANPMYMAPEMVRGAALDTPADIYALGTLLFEMLSGRPPYQGDDPLEVALQHVKQNVPSLLSFNPSVPAALDLVLQRALERDPGRRNSSAGKLVAPFERVLNLLRAVTNPSQPVVAVKPVPSTTGKQWIPMPGMTSGKIPAVQINDTANTARVLPVETGKLVAHQSQKRLTGTLTVAPQQISFDPIVLNASPSTEERVEKTARSGKPEKRKPAPKAKKVEKAEASVPDDSYAAKSKRSNRRAILLATGSIVAAGAMGVVGYSLLPQIRNLARITTGNNPNPAATKTTGGNTPATKSAVAPTPGATTPATGNVLATAGELPTNAAKPFVLPGTETKAILVHLPAGDYVAYERACTHQGVAVNYNADTHMLVCPLHFSIYDPANKAAVLDGPAPTPLKMIEVKVNADGSVSL
jgi:serine/threonine protein kinase/Rieske Fe-S protein